MPAGDDIGTEKVARSADVDTELAFDDLQTTAAKHCPRKPDSNHSIDDMGRLAPVDTELVNVQLGGVRDLTHLGLRLRKPTLQCCNESLAPNKNQPLTQRFGGIDRCNGDLDHIEQRSGIEIDSYLHEANAGDLVARKYGSLGGSGPAPARQQREVQIEHWEFLKNMRLDDLPEGHNNAEICIHREHVFDVVAHLEPKSRRCFFHRARRHFGTTTAPFVGSGDHEHDLETRSNECFERRYRNFGCTEKNNSLRPSGWQRGELRHLSFNRRGARGAA